MIVQVSIGLQHSVLHAVSFLKQQNENIFLLYILIHLFLAYMSLYLQNHNFIKFYLLSSSSSKVIQWIVKTKNFQNKTYFALLKKVECFHCWESLGFSFISWHDIESFISWHEIETSFVSSLDIKLKAGRKKFPVFPDSEPNMFKRRWVWNRKKRIFILLTKHMLGLFR